MKKLITTSLVALAILATSSTLSAQDKPINVGIKGAVGLTNTSHGDSRAGYRIGAVLEYGLTDQVYVQSGLEFAAKGSKIERKFINSRPKISPLYLQIPIHMALKVPISDITKLTIDAGPYLAYGISGKMNLGKGRKHNIFGKKGMFDRFDAGLGFGAGLEVQKLVVRLGFDFGLVNAAKKGPSVKNKDAMISVAYML